MTLIRSFLDNHRKVTTMLRSRLSSLFLIATLALVAFVDRAASYAVATYRTARDWVFDHALSAARLAPTKAGEVAKQPEQMLRVAKAFVARLIRRERPRIENAWRMCPST